MQTAAAAAAADTRVWNQNTSSFFINWVGNYHQLLYVPVGGDGFVNSLGTLAGNQPMFRAPVASKGRPSLQFVFSHLNHHGKVFWFWLVGFFFLSPDV